MIAKIVVALIGAIGLYLIGWLATFEQDYMLWHETTRLILLLCISVWGVILIMLPNEEENTDG